LSKSVKKLLTVCHCAARRPYRRLWPVASPPRVAAPTSAPPLKPSTTFYRPTSFSHLPLLRSRARAEPSPCSAPPLAAPAIVHRPSPFPRAKTFLALPRTCSAPPRARLSPNLAGSSFRPTVAIDVLHRSSALPSTNHLRPFSARLDDVVSFPVVHSTSPALSPFGSRAAAAGNTPRHRGCPSAAAGRLCAGPRAAAERPAPSACPPRRRPASPPAGNAAPPPLPRVRATRRPWPWPGCLLFLPQNRNFWFWNPEVPVSS